MGTFYVNDTNGNDGTGTEDNPALPYKTIGAALADASTSGDIVEITDEATYDDESFPLTIQVNNITLTHTASALGRPKIDATSGGTAEVITLNPVSSQIRSGFTLNGVEVEGSRQAGQFLLAIYSAGAGNVTGLTVTDCFAYGLSGFANGFLNAAAAQGSGVNVKRSSFMFNDGGFDGFMLGDECQFHIQNCFVSRSGGGTDRPIIAGGNGTNQIASTASFCTFVYNTGSGNGQGRFTIKRFGKMINCAVTASGNREGVDSNNHSYNIVNVPATKTPFYDGVGNADSPGTGDLTSAITWVDGTSNGHSLTVVSNYALAAGSNGIDVGITFDSVDIDITGNIRPQGGGFDMGAFELPSPPWNDYDDSETYGRKFGSGFEIHGTANKLTTRTFPNGTTGRQAPYFVTIPGPANLRRRTTPYKNET